MNIFVLDTDIEKIAKAHCDKHVVKMTLEYTQLLSTTLKLQNIDAPYKVTHINHPCTKWVRASKKHYEWLWNLTMAVGKEYTARYNKVHKSHQYLIAGTIPSSIGLPDNQFVDPPNCTPYKDLPLVEAYRKYYKVDKSYFAKWKLGNQPEWFCEA